jgi:secreted trypsin-like serine protease
MEGTMRSAGAAGRRLAAVLVLSLAIAGASHAALVGPRIIGGQKAVPGQFPELAFVIYREPDGEINFTCSGTVIAPKLVLTAGHCAIDADTGFHGAPGGFVVVTGTDDVSSPAGRIESRVSQVFAEPKFNRHTLADDAAVLELAQPTAAAPVALAGPADASLYSAGTAAEIAGWGDTHGGQVPQTTSLRWAHDVVRSSRLCARRARGSLGPGFDGALQTCALDTPSDATGSCEGDSGGPLLAQSAPGTWLQIGVTSFGAARCSTRVPSYFTRTDALAPWVDPILARAGTLGATAVGPSSPHPVRGTYRARTSQHRRITVRVARSGRDVGAVALNVVLRCGANRRIAITDTMSRLHWRLAAFAGFGLQRQFRHDGVRYRFGVQFLSTGEMLGELTAREGRCSSGAVDWQGAHRA